MQRILCFAILLVAIATHAGLPLSSDSDDPIIAVVEGSIDAPGEFGLKELEAALRKKNISLTRASGPEKVRASSFLWIGIPRRAARLHDLEYSGKISVPANPESYTIRRVPLEGKTALVFAGQDDRGLMYALLDAARRIDFLEAQSSADRILGRIAEKGEKPEVPLRGIIQFLHSADLERHWYYDPEYWSAYLGMLARDRFNSLNLVFAHQTEYLAPPYPFLFNIEKYPQVKVPGLSAEDQSRNLRALQMISRMAHERGIDFIMGIWEHRAWKRGQKSMVEGLTDDILVEYSRLAMEMLLQLCPDIHGIQLRVNTESGIENDRQTMFYRDGVLAGMKASGRPILLDLRGWGALPGTIDAAVRSNLPIRLSMKYWAEFMGMPYPPAQMLPSYSYADFLGYPRNYPVVHQVWSLGSHRLLPWGSVAWMKRFAPTARFGDALGFETCAPLSQKGFGNPPGDWRIFASKDREYYRWEFERYWLYYLLYGRLTYNSASSPDVWMDEFKLRFGERASNSMFDAFQAASEVIPFLVSYRLSNPNMYIWPEKQMGGLLDFYIEVKPADMARFLSFDEYVAARLRGVASAKMTPEEAADRLVGMAADTERALSQASLALKSEENKEFAANRIDLEVLSLLARYHAQKIRAGAALALFYASGDESALRTARSHAGAGLEIWERLARLTDGVFHPKMVFGPRDVGHWKDNLVFVRHDLRRLEEVEKLLDRYGLFDLGLDFGSKIVPRRSAYEPQYGNSYPVERRFHSLDSEMTYSSQRGYGWRDTSGIRASEPMRIPYTSLEGDNLEDLSLPSDMLYKDFLRATGASVLLIDLPDGDYRVTSIVANQPELAAGAFQIRELSPEGGMNSAISYAAAETGDKSMEVRVRGGRLLLEFIPEKDWLVSGLILARRAPHIAHIPVQAATPGQPLRIAATITAPDGIAEATLHYRLEGADQFESVGLRSEGREFSATLQISKSWNGKSIEYFISSLDRRNQTGRFPTKGYFSIAAGTDADPPSVEHSPQQFCDPGKPLPLSFFIRDASPLRLAKLYYRHITQVKPYQTLDLTPSGDRYEAVIPGAYIETRYDLMYYLETVDRMGNRTVVPNADATPPYIVVRVRR